MSFSEIYSTQERVLSLEFFPPQQEAQVASAVELIRKLAEYRPHYMTVTYRPGGSSRHRTREMVSYIHNELDVPAVAHLTCVGHSVEEIDSILDGLAKENISKVLALRGDPPKDQPEFVPHPNGFHNARDLTAHIAGRGGFSVAVAGYPETHQDAESPARDIEYLKEKVGQGAEVILTQLFFDPMLYCAFRDRCVSSGIEVPIVPGIMPIANVSQLKRFTSMCGASIPESVVAELGRIQDDASSVERFGIDYAIEMCRALYAEGAPGVHLYTLNKSTQVAPIMEALQS